MGFNLNISHLISHTSYQTFMNQILSLCEILKRIPQEAQNVVFMCSEIKNILTLREKDV